MPNPPRPARSLPPVPNLEQQKKLARELLDAARAHDPAAIGRFRIHHPRWTAQPDAESLALHDAQLVLAREYGFSSWTKLKAHIDATVAARRTRPLVREIGYYEDRARGLVEVLADGASATLDQVRSWHPGFTDASDDSIRAAAAAGGFTIDDARLIYAREHGFPDWSRFAEHLDKLARGIAEEPFIEIVEAGKRGDWRRVSALLRAHPELIGARGTNGNTLLNLASSLVACRALENDSADEDAPSATDRLAPLRLLLAAGADADQPNDRGWTPLHQAGYRNDAGMARLLLNAGARADLEAHGEGGTPLAVALFWGNRQAADVLAAAGIVPHNLRAAAGLGRIDLMHRCFTADGALTTEARAARGFYRPHSGFPTWKPSDDPQEVLDEALVWAAKSDRTEAMAFLVDKGARIDADPYRGTALLWAAAAGRIEAARWLLDRGADVNQRATFGGPRHGEDVTALHLAAQNGNLEMVRLLVEWRVDPMIRDGLNESTPAGWGCALQCDNRCSVPESPEPLTRLRPEISGEWNCAFSVKKQCRAEGSTRKLHVEELPRARGTDESKPQAALRRHLDREREEGTAAALVLDESCKVDDVLVVESVLVAVRQRSLLSQPLPKEPCHQRQVRRPLSLRDCSRHARQRNVSGPAAVFRA